LFCFETQITYTKVLTNEQFEKKGEFDPLKKQSKREYEQRQLDHDKQWHPFVCVMPCYKKFDHHFIKTKKVF